MATLTKQTGDALLDRAKTSSIVAILVAPFVHWLIERMVASGLQVGAGYEAQALVAASSAIVTTGVWLKKRSIVLEKIALDALDERLPAHLHTILPTPPADPGGED